LSDLLTVARWLRSPSGKTLRHESNRGSGQVPNPYAPVTTREKYTADMRTELAASTNWKANCNHSYSRLNSERKAKTNPDTLGGVVQDRSPIHRANGSVYDAQVGGRVRKNSLLFFRVSIRLRGQGPFPSRQNALPHASRPSIGVDRLIRCNLTSAPSLLQARTSI
jgi:hypothetical protein